MARQTEGPWFRTAKDTWYATVEGKSVSLGVKGEAGRQEALTAWHRLMAGEPAKAGAPVKAEAEPAAEAPAVRELVAAFMADAECRLKPSTLRLYRAETGRLCQAFGKARADKLTAPALSLWLSRLRLSSTAKNITIRAVSAVLGWAVRTGLLAGNPARPVPKPKARSRSAEALISDADHAKLAEAATPAFRLVLRVLHGTGCRPGEVCRITVETFNADAGCVVIADHKTDGTGKPRLIFLPPDVCGLLKAQAERYGSGPLLRSRQGRAYGADTIREAMARLRKRTGVKAIAYGYRHGFATAALASGVPDATVAALMGHSSTAMVYRHYGHLTSQAGAMRDALARVRG